MPCHSPSTSKAWPRGEMAIMLMGIMALRSKLRVNVTSGCAARGCLNFARISRLVMGAWRLVFTVVWIVLCTTMIWNETLISIPSLIDWFERHKLNSFVRLWAGYVRVSCGSWLLGFVYDHTIVLALTGCTCEVQLHGTRVLNSGVVHPCTYSEVPTYLLL